MGSSQRPQRQTSQGPDISWLWCRWVWGLAGHSCLVWGVGVISGEQLLRATFLISQPLPAFRPYHQSCVHISISGSHWPREEPPSAGEAPTPNTEHTGSQGQCGLPEQGSLTMGGMAAARCFSCFRSSGFWGEVLARGSPAGVRRLGLGDSSLGRDKRQVRLQHQPKALGGPFWERGLGLSCLHGFSFKP